MLEIFGGCARLTASLRGLGYDAIAIDYKRNKSIPEGPSCLLDVTDPEMQAVLYDLLRSGRLRFVHLAPPCGTASRAREKPLPAHILKLGVKEPQNLRSSSYPMGLPGLEDEDAIRVSAANELYTFTAAFATECHLLHVLFSIGNPKRSYMWETPMFLKLKQASNCTVTTFAACRHGSKRDKQTSFWHNVAEFCILEGGCPGGHEHAPWGVQRQANRKIRFATGSEAAYPHLLCQRMASCIQDHFAAAGTEICLFPITQMVF